MNDSETKLSQAGQQRRQEILDEALTATRQRKRRRHLGQGLGAAIAIIAVMLVARPWAGSIERTSPADPQPVVRSSPGEPEAAPFHSEIPEISDEELLRELKAAGRPAGIAYIDGKGYILFH